MSVIFQILLNFNKVSSINKSLKYSSSQQKCLFSRLYSGSPKKFIPFDKVVAQRKAEARRSLVIQVNSKTSYHELYTYCSKYADIEGCHHYKNRAGEHFILIEFKTESNVKDIIKHCASHQNNTEAVAVCSPFLWFRATSNKVDFISSNTINTTLNTIDGSCVIDQNALVEELIKCDSVSNQIQMLYDKTSLNDIGTRLRYMVARQLEMVFKSLYANVELWPFGSSVNGFGKIGCDLDLIMTNNLTEDMCVSSHRLVYQEKQLGASLCSPLETVAHVLEAQVAGATRVTRVLHARVPILKFSHDLVHLDCDLTYNTISGLYMSELLYVLCGCDPRVGPLTNAVRRWGAARSLTNPRPGRWFTNFALTLMVLAFLQQHKILPPIKLLVKSARKEDIRKGEDNLNCTFLRDISLLNYEKPANDDSLETLLLKFYEYYSQFDFHNKAISVTDGAPVRKPNSQPVYIVNPLDVGLNVSKNVSYEECERFKLEVRNAAWLLDAEDDNKRADTWGLLGLFESRDLGLKKLVRAGNSHRLVLLKDLFKDELEGNGSPRSLDRLSDKYTKKNVDDADGGKGEQKLKFKNPQVRSEVMRIRRNKIA